MNDHQATSEELDTIILELAGLIDHVTAPATCEIMLEHGQDGFPCGKEEFTFCGKCGRSVCQSHSYICCTNVFGSCCISEHKCAINVVMGNA